MSSQAEVDILKAQFKLQEGKYDDFYKLHNTWCITKAGAHKIAQAAGITMEVTDCDILPISIAYRGKFTWTPEGGSPTTIQEIGSCRWDSGKNNPECTHAPEMAWKRLHVRGVLALVAPCSGIYGADEMTDEWHKGGNSNAVSSSVPPPTQPSQQQAPAPQPAPSGNIPDWVAKLPQEWNMVMGKIAENTHMARSEFELPLLNHASKALWNGKWYDAATQHGSFEAFANARTASKPDAPNGWPLYNKALDAKKKVEELAKELVAGREVTLELNKNTPEGGAFTTMTIAPRGENGPPRSGNPVPASDAIPDDIPF